MKFYNTSLERVRIFEIGKSEYALYMATPEGNVAIVMPGKDRPEIYESLAEAHSKVDEIYSVHYNTNERYAKATVA